MAGPEEPLAPRTRAPPPAAGAQPGSGHGQLRPEPPRPAPSRAGPAGGPGAQCARGGGGGVAARAPAALASACAAPPAPPPASRFWPPPPPALLPFSSAYHLRVRLPARGGAAAARGGGGLPAAPSSAPPSGSPRGSGGRRRLVLSPALQGLLLPARGAPWPPPPRLPLRPAVRFAGPPGFALAAAAPLLSGSDMEDGPSNNASCFRRLTECFLSPSKCRLHVPAVGAAGRGYPGAWRPAGFPTGAPQAPRAGQGRPGGRRALRPDLLPAAGPAVRFLAALPRHVVMRPAPGPRTPAAPVFRSGTTRLE